MIAALFPGQNSQVVGMGHDLYKGGGAARRALDEAERALPGLLKLMWEGPEEALKKTAHQQPALVAVGAAAFAAYLEEGGEAPAYAAGHSLGEFTAHVAAGSLALGDAVRLVHKRGQYMQDAVPEGVGAMAAILKTGRDHVERVCQAVAAEGGVVEVANLNAPEQTVISGEAGAVEAAAARLKAEGARVVRLNVSAPFHCRLMRPAAERLARDLRAVAFAPPRFPVLCNVTADVLPDIREAPRLLEAQVTAPVRWTETLERLQALGVTRTLEFGSGAVLSGLVKRTLTGVSAHAVTDRESLAAVKGPV
ncbi:ACP S-malonyltransferase [Truepera radiovictrix]|uniref:Malonyl CoA-acyl carrier protein transacylase n=1 Tax=Truepera radiovictrix (strain DSM 17093 / CIP 108686 / LMG 22925 / RQ-24) TaxID=649638 RepID=D7CV67_TRURR|nr:ACP S-malonyltransferase [Truepera radiovictrix]ADI15894.1 malonyl CoA-acyl carrier protein transacylase [Truepera radiovictrix DSM 17093]WMT58480.1 ACP S-malonyltransferase [Truepera radiovictrix]